MMMSRQENDLISRQAAIMHFVRVSKDYECRMFELKEVTHELWQIPTAESGWIPVTERLPEEGVMVLVTCYGRDMIIMRDGESLEDAIERVRKEVVNVTIGLVGSDGWYGADYFPMIITPIAWMPLPDPWKGGEE